MTAIEFRIAGEGGQWTVYLTRLLDDGVRRERLGTYRTRRAAEIFAASAMRSAHRRGLPGEAEASMGATQPCDAGACDGGGRDGGDR